MVHKFVLFIMVSIFSQSLLAEEYSREFSASDASKWFFGPEKPAQVRKELALNIGSISLGMESSINCGKLNFKGVMRAGVENLKSQLNELEGQIKDMFKNPGDIAFITICYMQKNMCSHLRHLSAYLQRELRFQYNACQAIDDALTDDSSTYKKQLKAETYKECVASGESQEYCRSLDVSKVKDISKPFTDEKTREKQNVLESAFSVVKEKNSSRLEGSNYDIWSKVWGDTRLHENGDYKHFYPNKEIIRPTDLADHIEAASSNLICDINSLKRVIQKSYTPTREDAPFSRHVIDIIQKNIGESVLKDLSSLPPSEMNMACNDLGDTIAGMAMNRLLSEGRSEITLVLSNDAIPKELKSFYQNKADETFKSIEARIKSDAPKELPEILSMLHKLGKEYRHIMRDEAVGITIKRRQNELEKKKDCVDELSCQGK